MLSQPSCHGGLIKGALALLCLKINSLFIDKIYQYQIILMQNLRCQICISFPIFKGFRIQVYVSSNGIHFILFHATTVWVCIMECESCVLFLSYNPNGIPLFLTIKKTKNICFKSRKCSF